MGDLDVNTVIAIAVQLFSQFALFIWFASRINTTVKHLETALEVVRATLQAVVLTLGKHGEDIAVLKDRNARSTS